jgi:hypothetical protein
LFFKCNFCHSIYRQFLGCIQKFNRLIQIDDTGVGSETLDDQAAGCSTEPAGFFKIPHHGESHDKAGFLRAVRRFALAVSPSPVFRVCPQSEFQDTPLWPFAVSLPLVVSFTL